MRKESKKNEKSKKRSKKKIKDIERFLYRVVEVKLLNDEEIYVGYFVKAQYFNKQYEILPLDLRKKRLATYKSHIEKIDFYW